MWRIFLLACLVAASGAMGQEQTSSQSRPSAPNATGTVSTKLLGCRFTAKSFHLPNSPCAAVLSGFRIIFANKEEAIGAGYQPCTFCCAAQVPEHEKRLAQIRAYWSQRQRQIDLKIEAGQYYQRAADTAAGQGTELSGLSGYWSKKSRTSTGAAGLALMLGLPRVAVSLVKHSMAEELAAAQLAQRAQRFYAQAAEKENLAIIANNRAVEMKAEYKQALLDDAKAELRAECSALLKSVARFTEEGDLLNAALVSGLAWMTALSGDDDELTDAARNAMNEAMSKFRDEGTLTPQKVGELLLDALDFSRRGHTTYPLLTSYVVLLKEPANPVAQKVYAEIRGRWAMPTAGGAREGR